MSNGFVDLRHKHLNSESFWPSFTDIMMVIVMIFLMSSMILVVQNWKLLDQLRNSVTAQKKASRIIDNTSRENSSLEEQLAQAQNDISMLRIEILQAHEQHTKFETTIENKNKQIVIILNKNTQLKNSLENSQENISNLTDKVKFLSQNLSQLNINIEQKRKKLEQARQKIIFIGQNNEVNSRKLTDLKGDYSSLQIKYNKLIRPARTAKGKYVVSVNFERINGRERIRFKDANDSQYSIVNNKKLHKILGQLKKSHPGKLYIKIVIPKDSGLTYNEAWNFMQDLLKKYDYYSQE